MVVNRDEGLFSKDEDKIENLGDYPVFGRYSIFILILSEFLLLTQMSNLTFMVYGGLSPVIHSCGNYDFEEVEKNQICSILEEVQRNESCQVNKTIEFNSVANEFNYYCSSIYKVKNSISIQMSGVLIGAIIFGQLSDLFGRRKVMVICSLGMMIFGLSASYSGSLSVFTILQFTNLFFAGGSNS